MQLPKSFTTVTPFSKFLALSMFIVFPILAFWLGKYYQQSKSAKIEYVTQEKIVMVYPTETPRELIDRCGDIPDRAYPTKEHFDSIIGPVWSPDCRHISWSLWIAGIGYEGNDPEVIRAMENDRRTISPKEGVFVYSENKDSVKRIYTPKEYDETPEFMQWQDRDILFFKANHNTYKYTLSTQEISLIQ